MRFVIKSIHRDPEKIIILAAPIKTRGLWLLILSTVIFWLAGCGVGSTAATITPVPVVLAATQGVEASLTMPASLTVPIRATETPQTATATITLTPTLTTVPSVVSLALPTRLAAKNWKQWPVVPEITNRGREIYQKGLQLGNNPHAFSKVGDCQGIKEVLLGVYDQPVLYNLSPENAFLKETIDWFGGSFNRNGFAVMGGYNARAVLQPGVADPAFCQAGESPIACENRLQRPSIVIISLEFYYDGRTTANYSNYLRQMIEFFSAHGVMPILATKADNMEGDESLNQATAALALEYDLPLWNFWRAVQTLPNHGMDATRPDGFHISVDAWRTRSMTALQALDTVWRGVRSLDASYQTGAPMLALPLGATPEIGVRPLGATPWGGRATPTPRPSTGVVLDLAERVGETVQSKGVYRFDTQAQTLTRIFDEHYRLQSLSPDGTQMLVSQDSDLFLAGVDGSLPQKLSGGFAGSAQVGALWMPDGRTIALIADRDDGPGLWLATPDGSAWRRLFQASTTGVNPVELYASPDPSRVYWAAEDGSSWVSPLDGGPSQPMTGVMRPNISPDLSGLAYSYLTEKDKTNLALTTLNRRKVWAPLPEGYVIDTSWSPSGRWLAALWMDRSDYSGKPGAQKVYLLSPSDNQKSEFDTAINYNGQLSWSPDGRWLLISGTETNAEGYRINLRLMPVNGGAVTVLDGKINASAKNFIFIHSLYWIP